MNQDDCGYSLFGVCICEQYSEQMDKRCPYDTIDDCPVHNEDLNTDDEILTAKEKQEIVTKEREQG